MTAKKFGLLEKGISLAIAKPSRNAIAHWLFSRIVIFIALTLVAPALPTPPHGIAVPSGWEVFNRWDGMQYEGIAKFGYEFANDGRAYNVAFLPLFPLLIRGGMSLGLSPSAAGMLVNNLAFLAAVILLYRWVEERYSPHTANWVTAAFVWCPFSLFGSVVYTEGCFLLCAIAALRSFEKEQYARVAFWGALATATRLPALALIPAFLIVAWREKRPLKAYLATAATMTGLLLYMLYCWWRFGTPFAFYLAHQGWNPENGWEQSWFLMLLQVVLGPANAGKEGITFVDPWYPLGIAAIVAVAVLLWRSREKFGLARTDYSLGALAVILWLVAGSPLINFVVVWGGAYLVWRSRRQLTPVMLFYTGFSFLIIFAAQRTGSAERYAYGIAPLTIALGLLLERYPRWGFMTLGFFGILLLSFSVRFAQHLWVG